MSDRGLFKKQAISSDGPAPVPAGDAAQVEPEYVERAPSPGSNPTVKILIGAWLAIGLIGLAWHLSTRSGTSAQSYQAPAPYVAPAPAPSTYVEPTPAPPPQPVGEITEARIGADVSLPFYSINDTRSFSNGPTTVGLALRYSGYRDSDGIEVELYSNGTFATRCQRTPLNPLSGLYWCQFRQVSVGNNQFRVIINGEQVSQYDFTVAGQPEQTSIETPAPSRQPVDPSVRAGRNPNERAARDQRPERTIAPAPETVTCVLPSGEETVTTRQNCRSRSGVIY